MKNQKGIALVVSLVILLILTVIGLSSLETSVNEHRVARNLQAITEAFQAAEVALSEGGEQFLQNLANEIPLPTLDGRNGIWELNAIDSNAEDQRGWWMERDGVWWQANGSALNDFSTEVPVPNYVIEHRQFVRDTLSVGHQVQSGVQIHRITARGQGRERAEAIVQSTFAQRIN